MMSSRSIFLTRVRSQAGKAAARLLIDSIQTFGGEMRGCPVWVFAVDPQVEACRDLASSQVEVFPLQVPRALTEYPFGDKVLACAHAEAQSAAETRSLIWLDLECLVIQPPVLYDLGNESDAALRPVHLRNVGLSPSEALNYFWESIYHAVGVQEIRQTVESFVDRQHLRAYFNSHAFSINPRLGLLRRWYELFERLVCDRQFQETACREQRSQIFLFQALLSALVASTVDQQRIRILPPSYNYPYNLHGEIGKDQRAVTLNDLVSITFEGRTLHPQSVRDIDIREPLRTWLEERVPAGNPPG